MVPDGDTRTAAIRVTAGRAPGAGGTPMKAISAFPSLLESFFMGRLMREKQVSPHTITSYRDTFRLLIQYAHRHLHKAPSDLSLPDLDSAFVGAFLDHLEKDRGNSARSRNVRLAAIHSFFHYVALHAPEYGAVAQRVLAMPLKCYVRRPIDFLTSVETDVLLAARRLHQALEQCRFRQRLVTSQRCEAPLQLGGDSSGDE
jgi:site-specific recombinase XerD